MLMVQEVDAEIAALENRENHNASAVARLASLYTIRDHIADDVPKYERSYSQAAPPEEDVVGEYGDSDFLQAVCGKDSATAWAVMDELMDTLKVVNEKVYNSVMRKISNIP